MPCRDNDWSIKLRRRGLCHLRMRERECQLFPLARGLDTGGPEEVFGDRALGCPTLVAPTSIAPPVAPAVVRCSTEGPPKALASRGGGVSGGVVAGVGRNGGPRVAA